MSHFCDGHAVPRVKHARRQVFNDCNCQETFERLPARRYNRVAFAQDSEP